VRIPFFRRHPFDEEELSAHVDGRLSPAESARLERHLASCEACRRQLGELRAVVEGLRALPSVPAPRSFALRPEQVEAERRAAPAAPVPGIQRALAFGPAGIAVVALLLFGVLVGVDLSTVGGGGGGFGQEEGRQITGLGAPQAEMPSLGAVPASTPAPAPAPQAAPGDEKAGAQEYNAETPAPAEEAAPPAPETATEEGGGSGRWVLRGFEGAAGAAFVLAVAAIVWQRRRRAERR
jgi:anti-sigma factor RsiW